MEGKALVVRAFFSPDNQFLNIPGVVLVDLTELQSLNDSYTSDTIKDALIILSMGNEIIDTLKYTSNRNEYNANVFFESHITYKLEVIKDGFPSLLAEDVLPDKVDPDSILINPFVSVDALGNPIGTVTIFFNDPPDVKNYYEIEITRGEGYSCNLSCSDPIITNEFYYPVNPELNAFSPKRLLFTDQSLSSIPKAINFRFKPGSSYHWGENGGYHVIGFGLIRVNFRTVSKNYYDYQTSLLEYQFNVSGDPLFSAREPKNIFSNVKNGYGVFAAYQEAFKEIYIDDITY